MSKIYFIPIALLTAIFALGDQISKRSVVENMAFTKNPGIAFGIALPQFLIISLTIALLILIIFLSLREFQMSSRLTQLSLSLILAGGLSNLYDRLTRGFVVDFISLDFKIFRYPDFNLADAYIFVGVLLILLFYAKIKKNKHGR
ncbi:signal peptidase II [Candidatus Peregrinibacteria bacterium]|nr:signal peptidase II [Candidatus Peregrinibacteria bacterium]